MKYSIPKEIPVVFHNGSNYDYHFIIKVLTKGFDRVFNCLWEKIEKYNTFSIALGKKVKRIGKNGEEVTKIYWSRKIYCKFIIIFADNLTEEIHKIKCKYGHSNKTCETCGFKYKECEGMKVT